MGALDALIGGAANLIGINDTNDANRKEAARNRWWQESMSNSAHQREVADLKAAGLNPILSAGGGGSSTPSGSQATMMAPQIDVPGILGVQNQRELIAQGQQRIDIDKGLAASSVAKNLSGAELDKANALVTKEGALGRYFGIDRAKTINQGMKSQMKQTIEESKRSNPLLNQQPSSGGRLP